MTAETVSKSKTALKFDYNDVFFYASSLEEFKEMISVGLNKYIQDKRIEKYENNKDKYSSIDEVPMDVKTYIANYIRNVCVAGIKSIYPEEYDLLLDKYPFIKSYNVSDWPFKSNTEFLSLLFCKYFENSFNIILKPNIIKIVTLF